VRIRILLALALTVSALEGASVTTASVRRPVKGAELVTYAGRFTGVPYSYGANGPRSFDCSGFTSYVYAHFGFRLPRSSYAQMHEGRPVRGRLRLGDLVFWDGGGHVGIYTGNSRFLSATVHRGIWEYSFRVWRSTQPYTTARRILPSAANASGGGAHVAAASFDSHRRRNGGAADATPRG